MILLSANNISKSYGSSRILEDISFQLDEREMIGLIGVNGAGKTTLFRLILGEEEPDAGGFARAPGLQIGSMQQHLGLDSAADALATTLEVFAPLVAMEQELDELVAAMEHAPDDVLIERHHALRERFERDGGLEFRARTRAALLGLGFLPGELSLPLASLSGGQRSKISLARLLLTKADLILLDEPTNHLDIPSVEWLEDFLRGYNGAAIIISHDRYFLDRVTRHTWELSRRLRAGVGSYTAYMAEKARALKIEEKHYAGARREIERVETSIKRMRQWNREKSIKQAESKEKMVARMKEDLAPPERAARAIHFRLKSAGVSGNEVLTAEGVAVRFGERMLFEGVDLRLYRGERAALIGPNGCGKTTLLRRLLAPKPVDRIHLGTGAKLGYYDQAQADLNETSTPFEEISRAYPSLSGTEIRSALGAFLFKGDDVFKAVRALSGGERARVCILKLMLSSANVLLLDEPTNHLDIGSREALEQALLGYDGTLLFVSHDRYFINKLATKTLELTPSVLRETAGGYDDYLAHRLSSEEAREETLPGSAKAPNEYKLRKERLSVRRSLKSKAAAAERELDGIAARRTALHGELDGFASSDYERVYELSAELEALDAAEADWMRKWEEAQSVLEEMGETGESE